MITDVGKGRQYAGDLIVGMRVYLVPGIPDQPPSQGTVSSISGLYHATIERDDELSGSGDVISDYPYNGRHGWAVSRNHSGRWGGTGGLGELWLLSDNPVQGFMYRDYFVPLGCIRERIRDGVLTELPKTLWEDFFKKLEEEGLEEL